MTEGEPPQRHLRLVRNEDVGDGAPAESPRPPSLTFPAGSFSNLFDLSGKVALVVGGGDGIGSAIAHAFADHGARVVVAGTNEDAARAIAQSCARPHTGGSLAVRLALSNPELVRHAVAAIEHETERIDILVNAAGTAVRRPMIDLTPDEWTRMLDINLSAVFYVTQAVARGMLARGYGRILTLGQPPHSASTGGIALVMRAMATEWAAHGVTVNAICPAFAATEDIAEPATCDEQIATIPMGRLERPQDIVGAAIYLCSDAASLVTGQTLFIDGGGTAD